ncbi:MAG: low-specificity L-threonine aldolase [Calditrichia bacterium]
MNRVIDVRSDTITVPTPEMRRAMAAAEVGDDVFGEDPTVNLLQKRVAEMCGKEDALFVASGTMGNQICLKVHTNPGDEVIMDSNCHIINYEGGAPGLLAGVQIRTLEGRRGIITAEQINPILRGENDHFAIQSLICIENTHNRGGGSVFPLEEMRKIFELSRKKGLKVHLDGARLWNASAATGISLREYCKYVDSASLCFSKGLGAPVGSIIVGDKPFIKQARRIRKAIGGGMRQVGILAAAALYAIENHFPLLASDHQRAKRFADFCVSLPYIELDPKEVETNILIFDWTHPDISTVELQHLMEKEGLRLLAISDTRIRVVFHLQISDDDLERMMEIFNRVISQL